MGATLTTQEPGFPFVEQAEAALARGEAMELRTGDAATAVDADTATLILTLLKARVAHRAVLVEPLPEEMTTGQAADLLGVTRPTVVAMVDRGELPGRLIGTHRRVRTDDVLRLRTSMAATRAAALDELTELSADSGLYD